jgi:hypothetical protein
VDVSPVFLLRGLAAALGGGVAVGAAWGYALGGGFFGLFIIFVAFGVGWAIGELISIATNRKRGTALQACAVLGVIVAYLVHNLVAGDPLLLRGDLWGYLATALAAVIAIERVKP